MLQYLIAQEDGVLGEKFYCGKEEQASQSQKTTEKNKNNKWELTLKKW